MNHDSLKQGAATGSAALTREADGHWQLSGEVVFATVSRLLGSASAELFRKPETNIDLQHVVHMDSAGLALLLEWLREAHRQGNRLNFTNIPEGIMSYARVCGMEELLTD